jgi:CelD/BcsL family acetyltransferase involved in cellulose biosynthesis
MAVVELQAADEPAWEAFVRSCPDALVFHHPAWLHALRTAYGYEPLVLGHRDATGALDGVLPLVRKHGLITGRRLVSLPHTPVAGPVARDAAAAGSLAGAALERARDGALSLELKTRDGTLEGCSELLGAAWSTTFVLPLPDDPDALRFGNARNHRRITWSVGKASRDGVSVREAGSEDDLRAWHALYVEAMRAHAVPPRPYRFFAALWAHLRPQGMLRVLLAERERRLLAGSVFLMSGSTVFYAYNGRRREDLAHRPNAMIQWNAIHDAARDGFRRYDLGEVEDDQPGLVAFKKGWGARPEQLYRHIDPPQRAHGDRRRALERAQFARRRVWRRLPRPATQAIGDLMYRFL